jgi:hypothetical protein
MGVDEASAYIKTESRETAPEDIWWIELTPYIYQPQVTNIVMKLRDTESGSSMNNVSGTIFSRIIHFIGLECFKIQSLRIIIIVLRERYND